MPSRLTLATVLVAPNKTKVKKTKKLFLALKTNRQKIMPYLNGDFVVTTAFGSKRKCFCVTLALSVDPMRLIVIRGYPICSVHVSIKALMGLFVAI